MSTDPPKMPLGGLAVIEGVMIRSPHHVAVAVRRANGDIVVREERRESMLTRYGLSKIPLLRGVLGLFEMFSIGFWALNFSAQVATEDEQAMKEAEHGKPSEQL
jgi:uncharacterized protein YqhQ